MGTPNFSGGTSAVNISLPIFILHPWVWDQPVPLILHGFIFHSLVVGVPFSQIFRWFLNDDCSVV